MSKKESRAKYVETHREHIRQYQAEYYRKNFEKIAKRKHDKALRDHKIMTPEEKAERHRQAIARNRIRTKEWWETLRKDKERLAEHNKIASAKRREKYQNDPEFRERLKKYNREYALKRKLERSKQ